MQSILGALYLFPFAPAYPQLAPVAVGKPIIAKVADVTSRATAYLVVREFLPLIQATRKPMLNPTSSWLPCDWYVYQLADHRGYSPPWQDTL